MSTLTVVEDVLRGADRPLSVKEIVERAGSALPTKSKTPDTVVARDLSMDLKRKGETSMFIRTSPGRYTMRADHIRRLDQRDHAVAPVSADTPAAPITVTLGERHGTRPSGPTQPRAGSQNEEVSA